MGRPRAADDFATIRMRIEELRRERAGALGAEDDRRTGTSQRFEGQPRPLRDLERRREEKYQGLPPPWVPTIFFK